MGAEAKRWQAVSGRSSRRIIVLRGGGDWGEHPSFDIADAMKKSEGEEDEKESVAMLMRRKEEQGRGRGGRGGDVGTAEGQGGTLGEEVGDSNVSGMGDSDEEGGKMLREVDQVRQMELEGEGSGRGGRREGAVRGDGGEGERGRGVEGGQVGGVDDDCEYYVIRSSSGEEIDTSCFFPSPSDPFPLQKFLVEKGMVRGKERGPKAWISGRREGLAARVDALLAKLDGGQHAAAAAAAQSRNQSEVRGEGDGRGGGEEIKGGRIARGIEDIDAVESRLWREFKAAKEGRGGDAVAGAACPLARFLHNVKGMFAILSPSPYITTCTTRQRRIDHRPSCPPEADVCVLSCLLWLQVIKALRRKFASQLSTRPPRTSISSASTVMCSSAAALVHPGVLCRQKSQPRREMSVCGHPPKTLMSVCGYTARLWPTEGGAEHGVGLPRVCYWEAMRTERGRCCCRRRPRTRDAATRGERVDQFQWPCLDTSFP
jgi:tetratricopeptide (TPR) repeat protein